MDLKDALFVPFEPKKPVEAGLRTRALRIKRRATPEQGFAQFTDEEPLPELDMLQANLATLIDGFGGVMVAERKLDGYNLCLTVRDGAAEMLSSGGNPFARELFPELEEALRNLEGRGDSVYVGELHGIAVGKSFTNADAFAAVRARVDLGRGSPEKADILRLAAEMPLQLSLYDAYLRDGTLLLDKPMGERRGALEDLLAADIQGMGLIPSQRFSRAADVFALYLAETESGQEGLVLKNPLAPVKYAVKNGALSLSRTWDFVKLKKELVLDLVVIGYMQSEAAQEKGMLFSHLLCGVRNDETGMVETLVKTMAMTSPGDAYREIAEALEERSGFMEPGYHEERGRKVAVPDPGVAYSPRMKPDTIPDCIIASPLENSFVVRVRAMQVSRSEKGEHSCGNTRGEVYSLRHPVLLGVHPEKRESPLLCETTEKIRSL